MFGRIKKLALLFSSSTINRPTVSTSSWTSKPWTDTGVVNREQEAEKGEMDAIKPGWFSEINDLWPGVSLSLEVVKVLHRERSQYQDVMVLET